MLNPKQRKFVYAYIKNPNATVAAQVAGYSPRTAYSQGQRLLTKAEIKQLIAEKTDKIEKDAVISATYVLTSLKEIVERCMQRVPVMVRDPNDHSQWIQKTDEDGKDVWEFDANSANRALELLGKNLKLFTDRLEHSGALTLEKILDGSWDAEKKENGDS